MFKLIKYKYVGPALCRVKGKVESFLQYKLEFEGGTITYLFCKSHDDAKNIKGVEMKFHHHYKQKKLVPP